ncbi:MAG: AraC family transcriptional regulator [Bacteroidota bacterium]
MLIKLDVNLNIQEQFARAFQQDIHGNEVKLDSAFGKGRIQLHPFPASLELYHFQFQLAQSLSISSKNPEHSDWLLLNINLSKAALEKTVNQQEIAFQRYLPSCMLFYTPGTEVFSRSPIGIPFEIALIRFPKSFLAAYYEEEFRALSTSEHAIIYEDLDFRSEEALREALSKESSQLKKHRLLLEFLDIFFEKLRKRESESSYESLHPEDLKGLFAAAAILRDPFKTEIPRIDDLARIAGMGSTKFKLSFKQVFGKAPIQYRQKIRMEYAKTELQAKRKGPSELSYELGYSHPSKFSQAFKKEFGLTPTEIS